MGTHKMRFLLAICLLAAVSFAAPNKRAQAAINKAEAKAEAFAQDMGLDLDTVKAQASKQGKMLLAFLQKKYPAKFQAAQKNANQAKIQAQQFVNQNKNASVGSKLNQGKQAASNVCNTIQDQDLKRLCTQAVNAGFKAAKKNIPANIQKNSLNQVGQLAVNKAAAEANKNL